MQGVSLGLRWGSCISFYQSVFCQGQVSTHMMKKKWKKDFFSLRGSPPLCHSPKSFLKLTFTTSSRRIFNPTNQKFVENAREKVKKQLQTFFFLQKVSFLGHTQICLDLAYSSHEILRYATPSSVHPGIDSNEIIRPYHTSYILLRLWFTHRTLVLTEN